MYDPQPNDPYRTVMEGAPWAEDISGIISEIQLQPGVNQKTGRPKPFKILFQDQKKCFLWPATMTDRGIMPWESGEEGATLGVGEYVHLYWEDNVPHIVQTNF